jgi:hypothetical protein
MIVVFGSIGIHPATYRHASSRETAQSSLIHHRG